MKQQALVAIAIGVAIFTVGLYLNSSSASPQQVLMSEAESVSCGSSELDAVAGQCTTCHTGTLSFKGKSKEKLSDSISRMASGDMPHPVPIPAMSEADIVALAELLTCE